MEATAPALLVQAPAHKAQDLLKPPSPLAKPVKTPSELISRGKKQNPRGTRGLFHRLPCQGQPQQRNPPVSFLPEKRRKLLSRQCPSLHLSNRQTPIHPLEAQFKCPISCFMDLILPSKHSLACLSSWAGSLGRGQVGVPSSYSSPSSPYVFTEKETLAWLQVPLKDLGEPCPFLGLGTCLGRLD